MHKLIEPYEVLKMLGLKPTSSALSLPPYKDSIKPVKHGLYSYKEVLNYLDVKEARHTFLCEVQSLVLYMLDEVESKTKFSVFLGFKQLGNLDSFLNARIDSDKTAKVFVRCCRYRKDLVYAFDKYEIEEMQRFQCEQYSMRKLHKLEDEYVNTSGYSHIDLARKIKKQRSKL